MILLDTQVCIWWTADGDKLSERHRQIIEAGERDGIAISAITVWEAAMLVSKGRIDLASTSQQWLARIMAIPTLHIVPASPQILIDSTQLPGEFHKDPADRIIVATARSMGSTLLTTDAKILSYQHVVTAGPTP